MTSPPKSTGITMVFLGVPFLAGGLIVMGLGLYLWRDYFAMKSWVQTPAIIHEARLIVHRSQKGGPTYSIASRYSYRFAVDENGAEKASDVRQYENRRVEIGNFSSSSSRHRTRYEILNRHRETGEPFPAWVNPRNPAEAVLFREANLEMYLMPPFGLLFVLIGCGVGAGGMLSLLRAWRLGQKMRIFPGRPWRAEGLWDDFSARCRSRARIILAWTIAAGEIIFVSIFIIALTKDENTPGFAWAMISVFALLGCVLAVYAVYITLRFLKYGTSRLAFTELPVVPGRPFAGILLVPERLFPEGGVTLALRCTKTTGSGKHRHVRTLFEEKKMVTEDMAKPTEQNSAIPVLFNIPAELPERAPEANEPIAWTLTASAVTPGIDFAVEFDLPVYRVSDPSLIEKLPEKGWEGQDQRMPNF